MKHSLNSAVKDLLFSSRLYKLLRLQNRFYILAYHMVSNHLNGFFPEISVREFERQIRHLNENYSVISLEEAADRMSKGRSVRGCVAITFDDGFRDNYTIAYPILKKYKMPATIFLTTGFVETGETPWFIVFRSLFANTSKDRLDIELGGHTSVFSWSSLDEKKTVSDRLMLYLQTCSNDERFSILKALPGRLGVGPSGEKQSLMLTWEQVREMSRNGISFGAHTVTHPVLSQITPDALRFEIGTSKATIEAKTDRPVTTFAYPFGRKQHYPEEACVVLKSLGFTCAVTSEPGTNGRSSAPYELKRSAPWDLLHHPSQ
jgi:peptidoglycan/xylan/chitin deacetylase (PgdA/CDA1 family)